MSDCKYSTFKLADSPDYQPGKALDLSSWLEFTVNETSRLIVNLFHNYYDDWIGWAVYVVSVDREALGKNIFACPVCTNQRQLTAFPEVRHAMAADGQLSEPGKLGERFGNTTEVECSCGFYCRRLTFDTETWNEYEQ